MSKKHNPNNCPPNRRRTLAYLRGEIELDIPEDREKANNIGVTRSTYLRKRLGL